MKRRFFACGVVAIVAVALVVAACGSSSSSSTTSAASSSAASSSAASSGSASGSSSSKGPIYILSIGDISGPTKIYGGLHYAGDQAAVAYLNAHGGVLGRQLVIKHLDSAGVASNSVSLAVKELSANPTKYSMIDAGAEGTEDVALIPIVAKYKQFAITLDDTGGCAKASNCPTEFVVKGDPADPQVTAAQWFKSKGVTKVGILQESIAFTEGETPGIVAALKALGIQSTIVSFPATATDVTPEMQQLKSAGVDGVFAEALGPPAGYTLAARAKLGWNVPVLFDVAASSLDITKLAPPSQTKNAFLDVYNCADASKPSPSLTLMKQYIPSSYAAELDSQPCDIPGNGWDGIILFANAAKQAGSLSVSSLTSAMESLGQTAQTDPNYITAKVMRYSNANHENIGQKPTDFTVIPVGPVSGAQDHPPSGG
jgi:branched-chain amino acid transport system substrate-binding protein